MEWRLCPVLEGQDPSSMELRLYPVSHSQPSSATESRHPPIPPHNPRPASSVYSDDMSIMTSLIRKVSEETRLQEYQTIASYTRENEILEAELVLHRKVWNGTIMLANEVIQVITIIKKSLIRVDAEVARAEKDWLAFWGIYKESEGLHPPWL